MFLPKTISWVCQMILKNSGQVLNILNTWLSLSSPCCESKCFSRVLASLRVNEVVVLIYLSVIFQQKAEGLALHLSL